MIGLYLGEISALGADVGRIPAQILCGIGFLGAGTIIVTERKQVKRSDYCYRIMGHGHHVVWP